MWRHQKCRYRQRRTFNKSFSKGKAWHCKSIAEWISEQKLKLSLIKSHSKKLIKIVLFRSRRRPTWSRRQSSVQWRRGISTCVKGGVTHCKHWFWVKLALITFVSTFTTAVDNSTICTNRLLAFLWNFVPFWCCCVTAGRAFHFAT